MCAKSTSEQAERRLKPARFQVLGSGFLLEKTEQTPVRPKLKTQNPKPVSGAAGA
jgi:hypothetical protein